MKAVFINPPNIFSKIFPFGFSQVISIAKSCGFEVILIDLNNKKMTENLMKKTIEEIVQNQPQIVGLTGFSIHYTFIKELSSSLKKLDPSIKIVGGGYWCCWSPEFALENTECDIIINGEAEYPFREFCNGFPDYLNIKGISYKKNGDIVNNGVAIPVRQEDFESLPRPEYDLFTFREKYVWEEDNDVCCALQTARGCIGKCIFCTGASQHFRQYSSQRIIAEVKHVKNTYGVNNVRFKEALTIINNRKSKQLLNDFISENLKIKFEAICRVDSINEEVIQMLQKAGCYSIQFGIESADDNLLKNIMNKNITIKEIRYAVNLCNKYNILPSGGFLLGLPHETVRSLLKTTLFSLTTRISPTGVTFPVPFPGTKLYDYAKENMNVTDKDILTEDKLFGYDNFEKDDAKKRFLQKFHFCDVPHWILICFHKIISLILAGNRILLRKGYLSYICFFPKTIVKHLLRL